MARLTVAEFVAGTVAREEVGFVAGIPGSGSMELLHVLDRESAVPLIQVRQAQVAALMAAGYGKATRTLPYALERGHLGQQISYA